MSKKRVLIDANMTARWRRSGVMVGIVRVVCEMFSSLQKLTEVHMVQLEKAEGQAEPLIRVINPDTFEVTEECIRPEAGDLYLMPEIQIRGIHVPMDYPWPGFLEKYGIDRCALIHDILPVEMGEYFEAETSERMPEYLLGIFQHFNQIICVSHSVQDSVERFRNEGKIAPFSLCSREMTNEYFYAAFREGWRKEGNLIKANDRAKTGFFTNVMSELVLQCAVVKTTEAYHVTLNGYEIGMLPPGGYRIETFFVPPEILNPEGYQEIQLTARKAEGEISIGELSLFSTETEAAPVRDRCTDPVSISFVHEGVNIKNALSGDGPDEETEQFFSRKDGRMFLMVGTIEPRKGHELVLDTFERLWSEGERDRLCIVGRPGWNMASFVDRLKEHPEAGKRLLYLEGASDRQLQEAYRRTDALIQASAGEGFGLPLIEAGEHNRPILCSDIPVFHEVGGDNALYFRRDPEGLYQCLQCFKEHFGTDSIPDSRKIAKRSWDDFSGDCFRLMSGAEPWNGCLEPETPRKPVKKKVVVATTYAIYPPMNGGQSRVFGLYKNLAKEYWVELVCMVPHAIEKRRMMIAPDLVENLVPISEEGAKKDEDFKEKAGVSAFDMSVLLFGSPDSDYARTLRELGADAEWIVSSHPYSYPMIKAVLPDKKIIYEAQDVEYSIKKEMYRKNPETEAALKKLFEAEQECSRDSELIITCSEADSEALVQLYGLDPSRMIAVANGVDAVGTKFTGVAERLRNKERNGLSGEKIGIFMGAYHEPNIVAAKALIGIAGDIRNARIFLMGSQCWYFQGEKLPANVGLLGMVDDEEKERIFSLVDFALNPMISGSGTNVKMFDYMAAGVPVITTSFGSRGIDNKDVLILAENEELAEAINAFELSAMADRVEAARAYTEKTFDWSSIAETMIRAMKAAEKKKERPEQ